MEPWLIILIIEIILIVIVLIVLFLITLKLHNKMFKHRYECDPLIRCYTPEEFNLNNKSDSFYVGKNKLNGYFFYYDNLDKNTVVVFGHGMWSSHKSYIQEIEYISRSFTVYSFDYTGTDISEGKTLVGLSNGLKCMDYAIKHLKEMGYKNIMVVGHSWGGYNVTNVVKYHPDIKCVVNISGFISLTNLLKGFIPKKSHIAIPFFVLIEFFKSGKYAFANSVKTLKKYQNRALIIQSEDDHMVKYEYNGLVLKNKVNKDFIIMKGRYHNPTYSDEAVGLLMKFFNDLNNAKGEEKNELKKRTNFHKLGELDLIIMDKIVDYLKK